ncbi:MAG: hypothetical protein C3F02_02635 [Parcubacteria group bacterium]|nr:MAG: hypothetical protein C3F02_02635 [Parcubacteria group bacterium]
MNYKKLLIVLLFIFFVLGIGFGLYWVFFRTPEPGTGPGGFNAGNIPDIGPGNITVVNGLANDVNGLPWQQYVTDKVSPVATGGLTAVTEVAQGNISGLDASPDGLSFYNQNSQQFFKIGDKGQLVPLSDKKFFQVQSITWSGKGDKAILEYPDGSNILYNFKTGKQVTLPLELEDFSFSTDGGQISAKWMGGSDDNNWVVAAKDDGSGMFLIEPLGDQSYNTQIGFSPDNQIAALYTTHYDSQRQEVFPIGLNGENFKSFVVSGSGFESKWSPGGERLIYSVYSDATDYNPTMWVTQGRTSELGDLKVALNVSTWPDKCAFGGGDSMICAVPQGLPRGAGLYPEIASKYPDNFYSIDLNTGVKNLIASPVGARGSYSAYNLSVSSDGTRLYFVDKNTGTLQSIRLK